MTPNKTTDPAGVKGLKSEVLSQGTPFSHATMF
jgi:hypothetical protein